MNKNRTRLQLLACTFGALLNAAFLQFAEKPMEVGFVCAGIGFWIGLAVGACASTADAREGEAR